MRIKFTALLLAGICFASGIKVAGAEDVYVDLSVLNDLQPGYVGQSASQPLFPIVEKSSLSIVEGNPAPAPKPKKAKKIKKAKKLFFSTCEKNSIFIHKKSIEISIL